MKLILSLIILSACNYLSAQDKTYINDKNAEQREVKNFHGIKISDGISLFVSYGDEAAAVSATETKYRDKIKTEVKDGLLNIWYDKGITDQLIFANRKNLKAYVSYKKLDVIKASAGSDIYVDGAIKSNDFTLHISSGSDFKGNVDVKELIVQQSSGSDIKVGGRAQKVSIEASSGSDFNGYNLIADTCYAKSSSGSDINITVNKQLDAHASSGSDISYKGNPAVSKSKSSGGSVAKKG